MKCSLVVGAAILAGATVVQAKTRDNARLPNGNMFGSSLGHTQPLSGDRTNSFGSDYEDVGNERWTVALCRLDSDGDGRTNGEELGDPDCEWQVGATPKFTTGISNPGERDEPGSIVPDAPPPVATSPPPSGEDADPGNSSPISGGPSPAAAGATDESTTKFDTSSRILAGCLFAGVAVGAGLYIQKKRNAVTPPARMPTAPVAFPMADAKV